MKRRVSARRRIADAALSQQAVRCVQASVWPRRNEPGPESNLAEIVDEARHFGITTREQFRALLLKHRRETIAIDLEPLDKVNERVYRSEFGDAFVSNFKRKRRFFSWLGLTRVAFGLEFGEPYKDYRIAALSDKPPGIGSGTATARPRS